MKKFMLMPLALSLFIVPSAFAAFTAFYQGFETDTSGWNGTITREASGTGGITSSEGDFHANIEGGYSFFDGPRNIWPGKWTAEIDVYLDPSWDAGEGFDYTVASYRQNGDHLRDYIFHVGVVENYGSITDKALLVNGSNNTDFSTNPYKLLNDNGGDYYEVNTAGWYTLQHIFYDDGGALSVDLNLLDSMGNVLWTATRSNAADTIASVVGGNGYAWFTYIAVVDGIAIDAHELILNDVITDPETKVECKKGGYEAYGFKNQGQCIRYVNTGKDSR